jgi:CelD/BcsL family acetyltransferase involved in cellulose biosynthesis
MRTAILTTWEEVNSLEDQWNPLLKSSNSDTIFLTWEWIQAWRDATQKQPTPFVITVRDEQGILLGIAPFYQYKLRLLNTLSFKGLRIMGDYATGSEYADWVVHKDHQQSALSKIADTLKRNSDRWDLIWMPKLSGWNGSQERITSCVSKAGLMHQSRNTPFSAIQLPPSLDLYESSFSSKRRMKLRRNRRQLLSKPDITIKQCQSQAELASFLDALFQLHHRRRQQFNDTGCFQRKPAEAEFYRHFLPTSLDKGWLRFTALFHAEQIEAIQIGYLYNGEFLSLQEGFNPDFSRGIGNVLRHCIIEQCISEGAVSYDFLGGYSEHKRLWGAEERQGYDLLITHPSLKNRLLLLLKIWPSGRYMREVGLFDGN